MNMVQDKIFNVQPDKALNVVFCPCAVHAEIFPD